MSKGDCPKLVHDERGFWCGLYPLSRCKDVILTDGCTWGRRKASSVQSGVKETLKEIMKSLSQLEDGIERLLEELQEEAHKEGHDDGYDEGFTAGEKHASSEYP